jgi:hypothetical protein
MLLAQVAMLLKADFLGNPDCGIGTRVFLPFLILVRRLLGRFRFALLVGADAFIASSKKLEASACPLASCPSCSCCTGLATEEGTYAVHEPLAQPP